MSFERAHKGAHVIIRRPGARDPGHESLCVSQLPCPGQHVLVSSINLPRRSGSRDCKLVVAGPEIRSARGLVICPTTARNIESLGVKVILRLTWISSTADLPCAS